MICILISFMLNSLMPGVIRIYILRDTLKAFDNFKKSNKSVWSNIFWHGKVCMYWKCIQYTIHWNKTKMFKKFPSGKINGTKNALFFVSWAEENIYIDMSARGMDLLCVALLIFWFIVVFASKKCYILKFMG